MTTPAITIDQLDPVVSIDRSQDLMILRQGLQDKRATVAQVSDVFLADYPELSPPLVASDRLLLGRNNGLGVYTNYRVAVSEVGFLSGTRCWFYAPTAPAGWTVVAGTGDRILATVLPGGGANTYSAYGQFGTWQQENHPLTINQIPNHTHEIFASNNDADGNSNRIRTGRSDKPVNSVASGFVIGSNQGEGVAQGHNHGASWRPAANVGIICEKD